MSKLKCYMSGCQSLTPETTAEQKQTMIAKMFVEAIGAMARLMPFEMRDYSDHTIPKNIRVEIREENWDMQVRLYLEE